MNITFNGWKCAVVKTTYNKGGRVCLRLLHQFDGTPIVVATINMPTEYLQEDEVIINGNNAELLQCLIDNKVISEPVRFINKRFITCPVVKLLI